MWKAKVKDQLLACAIAFMWTWSKHTGKTERMVFVAKTRLKKKKKIVAHSSSPSKCVLRAHLVYRARPVLSLANFRRARELV